MAVRSKPTLEQRRKEGLEGGRRALARVTGKAGVAGSTEIFAWGPTRPEDRCPGEVMPDAWFRHAGARRAARAEIRAMVRAGSVERERTDHEMLSLAIGSYMAGYPNRPAPEEAAAALRAARPTRRERAITRHLLENISVVELVRIVIDERLPMRMLARAARECAVKRGTVVHWINRWARRPNRERVNSRFGLGVSARDRRRMPWADTEPPGKSGKKSEVATKVEVPD